MRRRILLILLLLVVATVAFSFYQPPARLMPTPLAFRDGLPNAFNANPSLTGGTQISLFYATSRLGVGPRQNRLYTIAPGRDLQLGLATIDIGDDATTWEIIYALSTGASGDKRPWLRLGRLAELGTMVESPASALPPLSPGTRAWLAAVDAALARSLDKDIIIFVHGANSTVERAAGQAAQMRHFTGQNSVVLLFAWPTAENFLRYPRDMVTAYGAAPQLARLIDLLGRHSKARNIDVLSYSAGATVASDGLALVGQQARTPGAPDPRLGEVYHAAPDADTRGFVEDLRDYSRVARRVTVAVNMRDSALLLSQVVNRASRAGRPDPDDLSPEALAFLLQATRTDGLELIEVRRADIPGMRAGSHSFWYNDPWVSSDVLITMLFHFSPAQRGLVAGGPEFWRFSADYPERLPGVMRTVREEASGGWGLGPQTPVVAGQ